MYDHEFEVGPWNIFFYIENQNINGKNILMFLFVGYNFTNSEFYILLL